MDAARLRAEFPVLASTAYLNAGTCGPLPSHAVVAAQTELRRAAEEGRSGAHYERLQELRTGLRAAYAARLGCAPDDLALTTSTTDGVATVLAGLDLGPGDEVVTSDTEHPGVVGPLQAARDLRGVAVRAVPLREVADAVGPRTRLVACSHVSWITGETAPGALARAGVPVLLDGAQGAGAVPVDVGALGCDFYAGSGQKWLCAPNGTGMLYVSPAWRDRLAVTRRGYQVYADANAGLDAELHPDARRWDTATAATEITAGALAAHDALGAFGWDGLFARARSLAARLAEELRAGGREVPVRGDTTLVSWADADPPTTRDRLAAAGVVVRDLPGRGLLRASVGAWNDESDLERLLAGLGAG
jgi:selenocysteine lyase/cysteine desulfurase